MADTYVGPEDERHHTRARSTFRSFIHKRTPSKGAPLSNAETDIFIATPSYNATRNTELMQADNPQARALGEINQNYQCPAPPLSPRKSKDDSRSKAGETFKSLHKKTLSTISLKSLAGKDTEKQLKSKEEKPPKPKKSKSSTNLAALLTRPRSSKNLKKAADADAVLARERDKENQAPSSSSLDSPTRPPIYAQFSSEHFQLQQSGGRFLEDDIDLYTSQQYCLGKPCFFEDGFPPSLGERTPGSRPTSASIPADYIVQEISRPSSRAGSDNIQQSPKRSSQSSHLRSEVEIKAPARGTKVATMTRRGAKAIAAAASTFGTKSKAIESKPEPVIEIKDVDAEFEAMLDRRNIPENHRHKMRSLAVAMKVDLVRQDWAEASAALKERPGTNSSVESAHSHHNDADLPSREAKRQRSRTFTFSKASKSATTTPTKKVRPESTYSKHTRNKSTDSTTSQRSFSSTTGSVTSNLIAKVKGQLPDDFVSYLRKVQRPEAVEVGKLHKLRLLLRNETVAWTDEFIGLGGMKEIIGLVHRIMEVEWREEHEDALLHEVLLCLKALCTTALALQHLNDVQSTLFPALIHMIFDEEKKGPSEFTTRNIITSLLFTYLKTAPLNESQKRAEIILSYLHDPEPKEEERPVPFVLEMRRERPYRTWCKEVTNVTKEVFWIFLHNLNVISLPKPGQGDQEEDFKTADSRYAYMIAHFPKDLPPVAAAPYVGGVEWDATNYLTSHLDLLNGIISCLPADARHNLRSQLLVSGWEKCMGGTLRTCKEKFYGGVHAGLRTWVAAAVEDNWDVRDVRCGPKQEEKSPVRKSPRKKVEEAPKLEMPKLDFEIKQDAGRYDDGGWL
jgi:hypothetical protein